MKLARIPVLAAFLAIPVFNFAQNETNHWMFGTNSALDFSSGIPVAESGCMLNNGSGSEGSAAISDPVTGNLIMYTDGIMVYTANHNVMPNGTGLLGAPSSTQGALIVPKPGSSTLFYIFTADQTPSTIGYNYSVVDMSLNGGQGDVIASQKNVLLYAPGNEQLSAVKHANCVDWWIMTKEQGNNVYKAYLLTNTGISAPVTSTIGLTPDIICYGQGKFSPDGTKYAIATGTNALAQLFDFDNSTGLLSNPVTLSNSLNGQSYGLSFSGDNSKLYVNSGSGVDIYQYDLSSGIPATIIASATLIGVPAIPVQLQLGKDFKIYISNIGSTNLSVISSPNTLGIACGFSMGTIPITGNSEFGLCNFPDSYFNQSSPCSPEIEEAVEIIPHIPNIITPNGDGINDVFMIDSLPPASSLEILNRWGNLVLTTDHYANDWMGHNSDGVYFYRLKTPDGRSFSGFVQVITNH